MAATAATKAKRPKYTEGEISIRDAARKLAAGKALANPIRAAQVRVYLRAAKGCTADPFAEGGPLAGMKVGDARKVARDGGKGISTRSVGEWRKGKRSTIGNSALDNNRVVVALALAVQETESGKGAKAEPVAAAA